MKHYASSFIVSPYLSIRRPRPCYFNQYPSLTDRLVARGNLVTHPPRITRWLQRLRHPRCREGQNKESKETFIGVFVNERYVPRFYPSSNHPQCHPILSPLSSPQSLASSSSYHASPQYRYICVGPAPSHSLHNWEPPSCLPSAFRHGYVWPLSVSTHYRSWKLICRSRIKLRSASWTYLVAERIPESKYEGRRNNASLKIKVSALIYSLAS